MGLSPPPHCILIHSNYESNMAGLKKNGGELVTLTRPSKTPALQAEKTRMNTTDVHNRQRQIKSKE